MKNIFKGAIIILVIFSTTQINAQIDTINFTLTSENVSTPEQDVFVSSTIIKNGNTLVWNQQAINGINTSNFIITGSLGDWDQDSSTGNITYNLVMEDLICEFVLTGKEDEIRALLIVKTTDTNEEKYFFNIDSITYQ